MNSRASWRSYAVPNSYNENLHARLLRSYSDRLAKLRVLCPRVDATAFAVGSVGGQISAPAAPPLATAPGSGRLKPQHRRPHLRRRATPRRTRTAGIPAGTPAPAFNLGRWYGSRTETILTTRKKAHHHHQAGRPGQRGLTVTDKRGKFVNDLKQTTPRAG
jgi:hypothetical protein